VSQLDNILQQKLTRKQFLIVSLSALTALLGITALLGALSKSTKSLDLYPGYGERHYGP